MSWHEFITMNGYAAYVWPAFTIVAIGLSMQWLLATRYTKQLYKKVRKIHGERYSAP